MALEPPFPELDELLTMVGEAGQRLCDIESTEGAAGNISVYIGWPIEPRRRFPITETINTPIDADKVEAAFSNGVLTLTLPKAEAVRPRQITVKAG